METLLFTGGSGFLGSCINPILSKKYKVTTFGNTEKSDLVGNIASGDFKLPQRYDIVLHAAGKAHTYPKTEAEIKSFYDVNYNGTLNLCKELERVGVPQSLIFISTMAVYGSDGSECVDESHPLNGSTPYAKSKILAEEFLIDWGKKNNVVIGILRPALLVGPNPPGNLGAMIKGIQSGRYLSINHGAAKKSFLMVYDIANVIPKLSSKGGIYNICDTTPVTYRQMEQIICNQLKKSLPLSIPLWIGNILAKIGDLLGSKSPINSTKLKKLTTSSIYSNRKITAELDWEPMDILSKFLIK